MEDRIRQLEGRLQSLERSNRRLRLFVVGLSSLAVLAVAAGSAAPDTTHDVLKTRHLLVVDESGAPRVILGAPIDDKKYMDFVRNKPMYGIAICDAKANEQIGIGVSDDGSASIGLDAKVGVGNPANRERLNFGVGADGSAMVRMLDNETRLKTAWLTDKAGESTIFFLDWTDKDGKTAPEAAMSYGFEARPMSVAELFGGS